MKISHFVLYLDMSIRRSKRDKRHKLEMYYDILRSISNEASNGEEVKPTRVQFQSNMAYDKLTQYLTELESKQMLQKIPLLSLTQKGHEFLKNYRAVKELVQKLGLDKI